MIIDLKLLFETLEEILDIDEDGLIKIFARLN